jgi:COMPASS component SWD3
MYFNARDYLQSLFMSEMTDSFSVSPRLKEKSSLEGHSGAISSLRYCPAVNRLASASSDRTIRIWDPETWQCLTLLSGHDLGISDIAWSTDGRYVCSGSDDKSVRVWNISSATCEAVLLGHLSFVFSVHFHPHAYHIVSGSFDETIKIWNTYTSNNTMCIYISSF